MSIPIKWNEEAVRVGFKTYVQTGNTAVKIYSNAGTPFETASLNLPDKQPADIVALKTEGAVGSATNDALAQALLDAGIVESLGQTVTVDGVSGLMCRIVKREG